MGRLQVLSLEAPWRLFPGFCPSWDFLPGPLEPAIHLKPEPKCGATCFQYSGKRFAIKGDSVLKRMESAHLSSEMGTGRCPSPPPLPHGHLAPAGPVLKHPRACPQSSARELVESGRYDTREDFSVVLQPFFSNLRLPVLEVCPCLPKGRENSRWRCQVLP